MRSAAATSSHIYSQLSALLHVGDQGALRSVLLPISLCGTAENAGGGRSPKEDEQHSWALQTVRGRATVAAGAEARDSQEDADP